MAHHFSQSGHAEPRFAHAGFACQHNLESAGEPVSACVCPAGLEDGDGRNPRRIIATPLYRDGSVCYIETRPNTKWVPPKTVGSIGNHGKVTSIDNGFHIEWNLIPTESLPTREDFIRRYWTSETEMNGTSNKYSPLIAQKM